MASSKLPDAAQRRAMLSEQSPKLAQAGKDYLAAGRWGEALDCLTAAGEQEALGELARLAAERGDLFYYLGAMRALDQDPELAVVAEIAQNASQRGLDNFARVAGEMQSVARQDG